MYHWKMRRLWAAILLAVFSTSLITPLLSAQPESKLPPCCRRDGKHRCAMMAAKAALPESGDAAMRGDGMKCPLFPTGKSLPAPIAGNLPPQLTLSFHIAGNEAIAAPDRVAARQRFESLSSSKRGPPAVIS